jgi:hypothetical protein
MNKKNKDITKRGKLDISKIFTGLIQHQSGAGQHKDKRNKRNNTRQQQFYNSTKDWE